MGKKRYPKPKGLLQVRGRVRELVLLKPTTHESQKN